MNFACGVRQVPFAFLSVLVSHTGPPPPPEVGSARNDRKSLFQTLFQLRTPPAVRDSGHSTHNGSMCFDRKPEKFLAGFNARRVTDWFLERRKPPPPIGLDNTGRVRPTLLRSDPPPSRPSRSALPSQPMKSRPETVACPEPTPRCAGWTAGSCATRCPPPRPMGSPGGGTVAAVILVLSPRPPSLGYLQT